MTQRKFVKRGNGSATHIAYEVFRQDGTFDFVVALCSGSDVTEGRSVTYVEAEEATCRLCKWAMHNTERKD